MTGLVTLITDASYDRRGKLHFAGWGAWAKGDQGSSPHSWSGPAAGADSAACGSGGAIGPNLHRISDNYGKPGIWACDDHGVQVVNNYAKRHGVEAVLPKFRRYIRRELRAVEEDE